MTCCQDAAAQAVDALERIETAEDLWRTLASVADGYGFTNVLAARLDESGEPRIVFATVSAGFSSALARQDFVALASDLARAGRPVLASEQPTPQLTPEQRRLVDYAKQNLQAGDVLLLPLAGKGDLRGLVALAGPRPTVPPVVRSSLHLLAHIAFLGADAKTAARKSTTLSPREAECLRLAAQGNTDTAIGRLLSISPRTARFHIENAKKKLGVTTRTQAVAEALRRNAFAA